MKNVISIQIYLHILFIIYNSVQENLFLLNCYTFCKLRSITLSVIRFIASCTVLTNTIIQVENHVGICHKKMTNLNNGVFVNSTYVNADGSISSYFLNAISST